MLFRARAVARRTLQAAGRPRARPQQAARAAAAPRRALAARRTPTDEEYLGSVDAEARVRAASALAESMEGAESDAAAAAAAAAADADADEDVTFFGAADDAALGAEPEFPYSAAEFAEVMGVSRDRLGSAENREVERVRLVQLAKDEQRPVEERLDPRLTAAQRSQLLALASEDTEPENPLNDAEFEALYEETRKLLLEPSTREPARERLRKLRDDWKRPAAERLEPRLLWSQRAALLRLSLGVYEPFRKVRAMYERFRHVDYVSLDRSRVDSEYANKLAAVAGGDEMRELVGRTTHLSETMRSVMEAVGIDATPTVHGRRRQPEPESQNEAQRYEEFGTEDMVFPDEFGEVRDAEDVERFDPHPDKRMYTSCPFCQPDSTPDQRWRMHYLNLDLLNRHVNQRGQIKPRRRTGVCSKHQRALTREIKYARYLGLHDYTTAFVFGANEQDLAALGEEDRLLLAQSDEDWLAGARADAVLSAEGVMEGDERTDEEREASAAREERERQEAEDLLRRMEEEKEAIFAEFKTRPLPPLPGQEDAMLGEDNEIDLTTAEADAVQGRVHPTTRWLEGQKRQFRRKYGTALW